MVKSRSRRLWRSQCFRHSPEEARFLSGECPLASGEQEGVATDAAQRYDESGATAGAGKLDDAGAPGDQVPQLLLGDPAPGEADGREDDTVSNDRPELGVERLGGSFHGGGDGRVLMG